MTRDNLPHSLGLRLGTSSGPGMEGRREGKPAERGTSPGSDHGDRRRPATSALPARRLLAEASVCGAVLAVVVFAHPSIAGACSTCSVGDPTLTVMGAEQPFAHRLRTALIARHTSHRWGVPRQTAQEVSEQRFEASVSYAPTEWLSLSVLVPVVRRRLTFVNLASDERVSLADLEVRLRAFVLRDRRFAPRHLGAVMVGAEIPTAPKRTDRDGATLPLELQTGSGSLDPMVGLTYSFFEDPFSFHAVSSVLIPTRGFEDSRSGISVRGSLTGQLQPWSFLGGRLGLDGRWEQATDEGEAGIDPNSGGFVGFVSTGLVSSPIDDLVLQLTLSVPVWTSFRGAQNEGLALSGGATFDF